MNEIIQFCIKFRREEIQFTEMLEVKGKQAAKSFDSRFQKMLPQWNCVPQCITTALNPKFDHGWQERIAPASET